MTAPPLPYESIVTALLAELGERWETPEAIAAAREHLIARIPGWRLPAAYGVGTADASGGFTFARTNIGEHPLPAVTLSTVLGYRRGTVSYRLDAPTLRQAVRLLGPAEVCTAYEHPNLWAWQPLLAALDNGELDSGAAVHAVFLDGDDEGPDHMDASHPGVPELRAIAKQA